MSVQLVSTFRARFWLCVLLRRNQQDLVAVDGEVLPRELAPDQELLVGAEVLIAAHVELVGAAALIHVGLVVGIAVVGVVGGIADVGIGIKLLQRIRCNRADAGIGILLPA